MSESSTASGGETKEPAGDRCVCGCGRTNVAECHECDPPWRHTFRAANDRDEQANDHAKLTGHAVWRFPDPPYHL